MPSRRRLATRDAVHDSLRLTRHNSERNGSRMVAEEAARRVLAVACSVGVKDGEGTRKRTMTSPPP
eukprot:4697878-Prymnesium_polylepis.1